MPLALNCDVLLTDMFSYTDGCGWHVMNIQLHKTSSSILKFSVLKLNY